jgi:hypothetical protein
MKFFQYITLLLIGIFASGQSQKIPPAQLLEDYNLFKNVLLRAHPNPYRFYDSMALESEWDSFSPLLKDSLNPVQFFQVISSMMSMVGEAHSGIDISQDIKNEMGQNGKLLPFDLHFQDTKAYILEDWTNGPKTHVGHELISINGKSIEEIMNRIDSISCIGTGYNRSRIYRKLSHKRNFALSYYLYVGQPQSYLIEYKIDGTDEIKASVVEGIKADFEVSLLQISPESTPPYSLKIDHAKNLAILKITTFAHFIIDYKIKDYLKFYKKSFEQISASNINNLVIDIRDNRGGQELLGGHLLSYFMNQPLQIQKSVFTQDLKYQFLDSLNILHHPFKEKNFTKVDSGYALKKHDIITAIPPQKKRFNGNVFILVNGNCFSACNIFAALADFHQLGTIIGEETGGNYPDTDGYFGVIFKLPNSGLGVQFRLWHLKTAVEQVNYGRGVLPGVPVQPSIWEVRDGKDPEMEKVYELIGSDGSN